MRRLAFVLFGAGLMSAAPAFALMPPSVYEEALRSATAEAILVDLDVRLDDDTCHVSGTVDEVRTRSGKRSENFPRRRKLTEVPARLTGEVKPEAGTRLSLTLACFGPDSKPVIGGHYQFSFERLARAKRLVVPVDREGRIVNAYGSGVHLSE